MAQLLAVRLAGGPAAWYGKPPAQLPERLVELYDLVDGACERFVEELRASPGHEAARREAEQKAQSKRAI